MTENAQVRRVSGISPATLATLSEEILVPLRDALDELARLDEMRLRPRQRPAVRSAQASATSARDLLETLAGLPALEGGPRRLDYSVFPLAPTVESVVNALRPIAAARGIDVRCAVEPSIAGRVEGDAPRLRQLLRYLAALVIRDADGRVVTVRAMNHSSCGTGRSVVFQVNAAQVRPDAVATAAPAAKGAWSVYRCLARAMGGTIGLERDRVHGLTAYATADFLDPGTRCDERSLARRRDPAVRCNLGRVVDLSLGGARMACSRAPRGRVRLRMEHGTNLVRCRARIVWKRPLPDRTHEIGLRFVKLPQSQVAAIHRLAG